MNNETQQSPSTGVPEIGRRRIALFTGACGTAQRVRIHGQIFDVPVLQSHLYEPWSPTAMLPRSMIRRFRAVQDAGITPVRGARLRLEVLPADTEDLKSAPPLAVWHDIAPQKGTSFTVETGDFPALKPGRYLLRIVLLGVDSIRQHMSDLAYLGTGSSQYSQKDTVIGYARLRILSDDFTGPVVTSDIDQTFLDTKIDSRQGLMETLFERIESKRSLPGMEQFYRALDTENVPLFFLSASPSFFRRTLEGVFERFQINHDALFLKDLLGPINSIVRKTLEVLSNIEDYMTQNMNEAMERSARFLGSTMQSIVDQIAYKLTVLLEQRTMMPTGSQEVLIGDNTESDYFIFTIYQHLLLGNVATDKIEDYFYHLNFHEREAINRDSAKRIASLVEQNLSVHGAINPVKAVWIHQVKPEMGSAEMHQAMLEATPDLRASIEAGNISLPVAYKNAFELTLLAIDASLLQVEDLMPVAEACLNQELRGETIQKSALLATIENTAFTTPGLQDQLKKAAERL